MKLGPGLLAMLVAGLLSGQPARAADPAGPAGLNPLARLSGEGVQITRSWAGWSGDRLEIMLSQPVAWRVFTLDAPRRLVLDFSELDWSGFDAAAFAAGSEVIVSARAGLFRPGWSRLVLELARPLAVASAAMQTQGDGSARISVLLQAVDEASFAAQAGAPEVARFSLPEAQGVPAQKRQEGDRPLVVVLDPGHGGIDPGAEREGLREADLVLRFARELKEVLLRSGNFQVVLTRDSDIFVPLEARVTRARRAGADVFISLHADALASGRASGASVYTLSEEASDLASQKLAERHDRGDLLAGIDLSAQSDSVALVLMDLARRETQPRSERLADALVEGIYAATGSSHKNTRLSAGFSVLKAPDIPSVLIELGYLSSERDRAKLLDSDWRRAAAEGIRDALLYWAIEDAAEAVRLRQ